MPRLTHLFLSALAAMASTLALQTPAAAQTKTFTCGRDFAQIGDSRAVVEMKCGKPAATDSFCKKIEPGVYPNGVPPHGAVVQINACEVLHEWIYKPGTGQFVTILRFREGELVEIKYGPRL